MNHIPTIVYDLIPNGMETIDAPTTIKQLKANIKEYGENIGRNYKMPLEYLRILNLDTPYPTNTPRRFYQRSPRTSSPALFKSTWPIERKKYM